MKLFNQLRVLNFSNVPLASKGLMIQNWGSKLPIRKLYVNTLALLPFPVLVVFLSLKVVGVTTTVSELLILRKLTWKTNLISWILFGLKFRSSHGIAWTMRHIYGLLVKELLELRIMQFNQSHTLTETSWNNFSNTWS